MYPVVHVQGFLLGMYLEIKLLGYRKCEHSTLEDNVKFFYKLIACSTLRDNLKLFSNVMYLYLALSDILIFTQLNKCKMMSDPDSDLISLIANDIEHTFTSLLVIW